MERARRGERVLHWPGVRTSTAQPAAYGCFFAEAAGEAGGAIGALAGGTIPTAAPDAGGEATGVMLPAGKTPAPESGAAEADGEG